MRTQSSFGTEPIKTLNRLDLVTKSITAGSRIYVPVCVTVYDGGIVFDFEYAQRNEAGHLQTHPESYTVAVESEARLLPLCIHGCNFFWDRKDDTFRWLPKAAAQEVYAINPWIFFCDNDELRIDIAYAEHNLSAEALAYAFEKTDAHYAWNTQDHSHTPVLYEIPGVFDAFLYRVDFCLSPHYISLCNRLITYAASYCDTAPDNAAERHNAYKERYGRTLWTPKAEQ